MSGETHLMGVEGGQGPVEAPYGGPASRHYHYFCHPRGAAGAGGGRGAGAGGEASAGGGGREWW